MHILTRISLWIQRRERAKATRARIRRAVDCLEERRAQRVEPPPVLPPHCGHSSHEYNVWAERHECCESRRCACKCAGAADRERRYAGPPRAFGMKR